MERAVPAMIFIAWSMSFALRSCIFCSAIAVIFFVLIVILAALLLYLRQRTMWTEIGGGA